jgi:hypothetical protein
MFSCIWRKAKVQIHINMNAIILSNEELEQKINQLVEIRLQQISKPVVKRTTNLDMIEAIDYLNEIGYKCSYSQLSKLTAKNEVPMSKFGRRISFNAADLLKWVESRKQKTIDISMAVAQSANSKLGRV